MRPSVGSAQLVPTENYALFALAEQCHSTVAQVLTGRQGPLSQMEFYLWQRWQVARARLTQQGRKAAGKK